MTFHRRVLTLLGDPSQVRTWSGTAYYFLAAGRQQAFLEDCLRLEPEKLRSSRVLWNLWSLITRGQVGGFQYSDFFLNRLFTQVRYDTGPLEFISHFPLLPPQPWNAAWKVNYYIDATLRQNFEDYRIGEQIGSDIQERALRRERDNYQQAERIVCMNRWCAASVVNVYGVPAAKVHIIPPGANLDERLLTGSKASDLPTPKAASELTPLRLGFVGTDWRRKGLPFLLQVADGLRDRGLAVEVIAIGPKPQELPPHSALRPVGFIDKGTNSSEFIELVRSFHFGCLFSSAEAAGMSNLDCIRLGVPVMSFRTGGIPDGVPLGLGLLFPPDCGPEKVADRIQEFVTVPSSYFALRQLVRQRCEEVSWTRSVEKFIRLWSGSDEYCYTKCT